MFLISERLSDTYLGFDYSDLPDHISDPGALVCRVFGAVLDTEKARLEILRDLVRF